MSIYGDRGNVLSLLDRSRRRAIELEVVEVGRGPAEINGIDIFFIGGGQDLDQDLVARDLAGDKRAQLVEAIAGGAVLLAVCGGYQFLGSHYTTVDGTNLPGLGLIDLRTEAGEKRAIGNVIVETNGIGLKPTTLVGFENHAGRTYLGPGLRPLGRCLVGRGNNGDDGDEGVVVPTHPPSWFHLPPTRRWRHTTPWSNASGARARSASDKRQGLSGEASHSVAARLKALSGVV